MTDQDVTSQIDDLKIRYGIEVSMITSIRSGFVGQDEIAEIRKNIGVKSFILDRIGV